MTSIAADVMLGELVTVWPVLTTTLDRLGRYNSLYVNGHGS